MDIHVGALEGAGGYHLEVEIVGTVEQLSREAILGRAVFMLIECHFQDCTHRYGEVEMRGDGQSFTLKFKPTTAFTYNVTATLRRPAGGEAASAVRLRLAVFPPESMAASSEDLGRTSDCSQLPQQFRETPHDVGNLTLGTFAAPSGGRQSWGEWHCAQGDRQCCADPSRVGALEEPCEGNYRHYDGQSFGDTAEWHWTCPLTGEYILQVTANCDVEYYANPTQPGCTMDEDGLHCEDETIEHCAAGLDLTITTIDAAVHVRHRFEVPMANVLGGAAMTADGNEAAMATLATLFRTDRQSGLAFPTSIIPFDCDIPEHAGRESCRNKAAEAGSGGSGGAGGGGHRRNSRRRLQIAAAAPTTSCPHDTFLSREVEVQIACSLQGTVDADATAFAVVQCPSRQCAEMLPALFEDCASSISRILADQRDYYTALEHSELLAGCVEFLQRAAEFAEVEVEFRAPSLAAANELVQAHALAARVLSEPGGCGADGSSGGGTCDCRRDCGRRMLQDETAGDTCVAELVDVKDELSDVKSALEAAKASIAELTAENSRIRRTGNADTELV